MKSVIQRNAAYTFVTVPTTSPSETWLSHQFNRPPISQPMAFLLGTSHSKYVECKTCHSLKASSKHEAPCKPPRSAVCSGCGKGIEPRSIAKPWDPGHPLLLLDKSVTGPTLLWPFQGSQLCPTGDSFYLQERNASWHT